MARYIDVDKIDFSVIKDPAIRIIVKRFILNKPTEDVAPKSEIHKYEQLFDITERHLKKAENEVDRLKNEVKILIENDISTKYPNCVLCSRGVILTKSLEDYDELIGDISSSTKQEVAREIFEEIEKMLIDSIHIPDCARFVDIDKLAELKKKYTEEVK